MLGGLGVDSKGIRILYFQSQSHLTTPIIPIINLLTSFPVSPSMTSPSSAFAAIKILCEKSTYPA